MESSESTQRLTEVFALLQLALLQAAATATGLANHPNLRIITVDSSQGRHVSTAVSYCTRKYGFQRACQPLNCIKFSNYMMALSLIISHLLAQ